MDYFNLLGLSGEPFANTPDPRLFYQSCQHLEILQKLEISLRLKRGLCVILGAVGTGKTMLSRQLIHQLDQDRNMVCHLVLDPEFKTVPAFLSHLHQLFIGPPGNRDQQALKQAVQSWLLSQAVENGKTCILIIDEGQKMDRHALEALRMLLNFETNDEKLLQIIIFAQPELGQVIEQMENFRDRIDYFGCLSSLSYTESKALILHRLSQCAAAATPPALFTDAAIREVYRHAQGSPRKMIHLCHRVILQLIIANKKKAGPALVKFCIQKNSGEPPAAFPGLRALVLPACIGAALVLAAGFLYQNMSQKPPESKAPAASGVVIKPMPTYPEKPIPMPTAPVAAQPAADQAAPVDVQPKIDVETPQTEPRLQAPLLLPCHRATQKVVVPGSIGLSHIIRQVYGKFTVKQMTKLMDCNPHIDSPDHVTSGTTFFFPVCDLIYEGPGTFLALETDMDFSKAFSTAVDPARQALNLRLTAYPGETPPQRFNVVLDKIFESEAAARDFREKNYPDIPFKVMTMVLSNGKPNLQPKGNAS